MLVFSLIALYVLIPQFANVDGHVPAAEGRELGPRRDVSRLLVRHATSAPRSSLVAACPVPVRYGNSFEVEPRGSFVNRITPAGVGGIGLNLRFMQKAGANTTEAASRWGVNALAGGVVHITLTVMFFLWAGKNNAFDFRLPEMPLLVGTRRRARRSRGDRVPRCRTVRRKLLGPGQARRAARVGRRASASRTNRRGSR